MASSPFNLSSSRSNLFASKAKQKDKPPPEDVTLIVSKSQVISADIPYSTKNANNIRQFMHANVVSDDPETKGQRYFIFRKENNWTTIHLQSTPTKPKLTGDPITVLKKAWVKFNECPEVANVKIKWDHSPDILDYDDIDSMEGQFNPLPGEDETPDVEDGEHKTDADVLWDKIDSVEKKIDALAIQMTHVLASIEKAFTGENSVVSELPNSSTAHTPIRTSTSTVNEGDLEPTTGARANKRARK